MSLFKNKYRIESAHLKDYDYSEPGNYYVTICLEKKHGSFGCINNQKMALNKPGEISVNTWKELPESFKNIWLGDFVFMPDHMHGIINIKNKTDKTLHDIVGAFKSKSTIAVNKYMKVNGRKMWQTSYYDRIIREEFEYFFVSEYILNNPIVWEQKGADKEWYELLEERQKAEKVLAPPQG